MLTYKSTDHDGITKIKISFLNRFNINIVIFILTISLLILCALNFFYADKKNIDNIDSISLSNFNSSLNKPYSIKFDKDFKQKYLRVNLNFLATSTAGNPNLIQTDSINEGFRLEIDNSTLGLIINDPTSPGGLKSITLTSNLKLNQWYSLDIEIINKKSLMILFNNNKKIDYKSNTLSVPMSNILLGQGYDGTRKFVGLLKDINLEIGESIPQSKSIRNILKVTHNLALINVFALILLIYHKFESRINLSKIKLKYSIYFLMLANLIFGLIFASSYLITYFFGDANHTKWSIYAQFFIASATVFFLKRNACRFVKYLYAPSLIPIILYTMSISRANISRHSLSSFILLASIFFLFTYLMMRRINWHQNIQCKLLNTFLIINIGAYFLIAQISISNLTNWNALSTAFSEYPVSIFITSLSLYSLLHLFLFLKTHRRLQFNRPNNLDIALMIAASTAFLLLSMRHDSLFDNTLSGIPMYHWSYFIGPIESLKSGHHLLWDTPSQYGFLTILLPSLIPAQSAWQSFYLFQSCLLLITSIGVFFSVRQITKINIFGSFILFLIIVLSLFFADPEWIGPYPFPSSSVVRFFPIYLMMMIFFWIPKISNRQLFALSLCLPILFFWSAETSLYGLSIYLTIISTLIVLSIRKKVSFQILLGYLTLPLLFFCIGIANLCIYYYLNIGALPDFYSFYEYAMGYASGFGYTPLIYGGPGNTLVLLSTFLMVTVILLINPARSWIARGDLLIPNSLLLGILLGISTYYVGRPVPQNITAILPILTIICFVALFLNYKSLAINFNLLKFIFIPIFFIALVPLISPSWITNLNRLEFYSVDIAKKLPGTNFELVTLLSNIKNPNNVSMIFYGDDSFGSIQLEHQDPPKMNWLPTPLQLLEEPINRHRRSIYLKRYFCQGQAPSRGAIIYRNNPTIKARLDVLLMDILPFYGLTKSVSSETYTILEFTRMESVACPVI